MINIIKRKLSFLDIHTIEVLKKSSSSSIVKIFGKLAAFGISIFLGRILGPDGLGVINLSNRLLMFLLAICAFGIPNSLIKETSIAFSKNNLQRVSNFMYSASILNGSLALIVTIIGILSSDYISKYIFSEPKLAIPLTIIFAVLPFQILSRNYAAGLIGDLKIWQSNLINHALSLGITGILLVGLWILNVPINIINAALSYGVGRFLTFGWILWYWKVNYSQKGPKEFIAKEILSTAPSFFLVGLTGIVLNSVDVIMLGWLGTSKEVGLYTVSMQLAMITIFFYQVTNSAMSPKISSLFAENRLEEMEQMIQRMTMVLIVIGTLSLIVFILGGKYLLLIWGDDFVDAYWILIALAVGQFFNIGTGNVTSVLNMCGFEKLNALITGCYLVLNIILNYLLILKLGGLGAAIATAIAIALQNITKVLVVKLKLNIWSIPIFIPKYFR